MSDALIIAVITAIVSIAASVMASALQYRKWQDGERHKVSADVAGEITDTSLSLVAGMRSEMSIIRAELVVLREENKKMRVTLTELEDVKDWAERLVHQVRSLGAEPVKMRVTEINP